MTINVALFGGGGFIGNNLAFHLRNRDEFACTVFDIDQRKLRLRFGNEAYRYDHCDIATEAPRLNDIVKSHDVVVHLAAYVHPSHFLRNPLEVVQLNFFDSLKVVDACVRNGKRLIHFSTSEVYGKSGGSEHPFREDETDCILGPIENHRWIYSNAKQLLDRIIHAHGLRGDLSFTIVRPFNFVGPLMDKLVTNRYSADNPRVFAHFMSALLYRRPFRLVNGGHSKRCFTYIGDAVEALELVLRNPEALHNQIVNIGNPANESSIRDLAKLMLQIYRREFDSNANNVFLEVSGEDFYGPGYEDCDRRVPDITKMTAIGWQPKAGLEETFAFSMRYVYENRSALESQLLQEFAA